jgi:hypothetical protein
MTKEYVVKDYLGAEHTVYAINQTDAVLKQLPGEEDEVCCWYVEVKDPNGKVHTVEVTKTHTFTYSAKLL